MENKKLNPFFGFHSIVFVIRGMFCEIEAFFDFTSFFWQGQFEIIFCGRPGIRILCFPITFKK